MKMTKQEKKGKRIVYVICFLAFIYMLCSTFYQRYLDTLPQDYTVGRIDQIWQPANGDIKVDFDYKLLDKEYSGMENIGKYRGLIKGGEYYLIKFPEGHPDRGIMLLDKPVPDSITPPEEGWDELPEFAQ